MPRAQNERHDENTTHEHGVDRYQRFCGHRKVAYVRPVHSGNRAFGAAWDKPFSKLFALHNFGQQVYFLRTELFDRAAAREFADNIP